jgi:spore germination protein
VNTLSKKRYVILAILLLMAAILPAGCARPRDFGIMGFYEKGWDDLTYGYPVLEKHYQSLIALMPFWYTVQGDGNIEEQEIEPEVAELLKQNKETKLLPLLNNGKGVGDKLNDADFRSTVVDNIETLINDNDYDGVNIDFELIPPESRDGLTALIKELSERMRNKSISVSVFPLVDVTEDVNGAYDYEALAKSADYLTIMTYDKHEESSDPGPVAPYDWVEENLDTALSMIGKEKIVLCIGAYGYDWPTGGEAEAQYMGLREILALADDKGAQIEWDEQSQSPHFTYDDEDGVTHEVWFENGESAAKKGQLGKDRNIRGAAIWRMGFEDDDYWDNISGLEH